jgi:hypothetical protein
MIFTPTIGPSSGSLPQPKTRRAGAGLGVGLLWRRALYALPVREQIDNDEGREAPPERGVDAIVPFRRSGLGRRPYCDYWSCSIRSMELVVVPFGLVRVWTVFRLKPCLCWCSCDS